MRRRHVAAASIVAALVLIGPTLSTGSVTHGLGTPPPASRSVQHTISYFEALRSPHRAVDRLPRDRRAYWRASKKRYGVRVGGARRVLNLNHGRVWLLPGTGYLCMDVEDKRFRVTVGGCQPTWKARRGLVQLTIQAHSGRLTIIGAVPDRTRHLRVVNAHHPPVPVRITNNAYHLSIAPAQRRAWKPRRIAFFVGHHRHRLTIAGHPGARHGASPGLRRATG